MKPAQQAFHVVREEEYPECRKFWFSSERLKTTKNKPEKHGLHMDYKNTESQLRRKLKSWVYLRLRLARPYVHLRWLAITCTSFGRDQIRKQVKAVRLARAYW